MALQSIDHIVWIRIQVTAFGETLAKVKLKHQRLYEWLTEMTSGEGMTVGKLVKFNATPNTGHFGGEEGLKA